MYTTKMNMRLVFTFLISGLLVLPGTTDAQVSGDILCPNPEQAAKNAPRNLSDVQADIERFNLCVDRARLLNELNDLSKRNQEDILNRAFAGTGPVGGQPLGGGLPPLPGLALDGASGLGADDIEPVAEDDILSIEDAMTPPKPRSSQKSKKVSWALRNVYGSSGTLQAELISTDGALVVVSQGDMLMDGSVVKRVSSLGVVLSKDGQDKAVSWVE